MTIPTVKQGVETKQNGMLITPGKCAWLSSHSPTEKQREDLFHRGYEIIQLSPAGTRAEAIWKMVEQEIGTPDLVVAVLPKPSLVYLARLISPIPVLQAKMDVGVNGFRWMGEWYQVKSLALVTKNWTGNAFS